MALNFYYYLLTTVTILHYTSGTLNANINKKFFKTIIFLGTLTDFSVKLYEKRYECCQYPFPDLTFFFVLKRSPIYYIFVSFKKFIQQNHIFKTLIIPSTCITVVTIVGFFTPHSTTGENTGEKHSQKHKINFCYLREGITGSQCAAVHEVSQSLH